VCTIVNVLRGLFAVVLVAQIILVMGETNPANGVASFVPGFSSAVSLGFDNLFTPASVKTQVLLNDGFAAIVWLAFGAVVTTLIRRFALAQPTRAHALVSRVVDWFTSVVAGESRHVCGPGVAVA
jgi:hypothetical protein